jgi:DNA end-binding protein Ku
VQVNDELAAPRAATPGTRKRSEWLLRATRIALVPVLIEVSRSARHEATLAATAAGLLGSSAFRARATRFLAVRGCGIYDPSIMAARSIGSGTLSFGLVSIPFKLYVAASPQQVRFNQLHEECGSRLKQQLYCPVCDKTLDRSEIVKGYEYAKGQFVQFTDEELKSLEAANTHSLEVEEFVPLSTVDLVQVDKSYYLGPDKGGAKAYRLFSDAMEESGKVAVGRYATRGKEQLVIVRPYDEGLLLHYVYYADEVRSFDEIDRGGEVGYRENELELAQQLIDQLSSDEFQPEKYRDEWRDRVMQAVEEKVAGEEITAAPQEPSAQVIDLFEALKESVAASKGPKKAEPAERTSQAKATGTDAAGSASKRSKSSSAKSSSAKSSSAKSSSAKSSSAGGSKASSKSSSGKSASSKSSGAGKQSKKSATSESIKPPKKAREKSGSGRSKKSSSG